MILIVEQPIYPGLHPAICSVRIAGQHFIGITVHQQDT